jgi:PKD repeat protein
LPLYWPAPPLLLSAAAGAHRFSWDLHYDPIGSDAGFGPGGGAVPYRTFPNVGTPFAPPGNYTVKLTVSGASYTQPLTLKLDPRVRTPKSALAQIDSLTRNLYRAAVTSDVAATQARALSSKLDAFTGLGIAEFKAQIDSIAGAAGGGRGRGGFGGPPGAGGRGGAGGPAAAPTLSGASAALMAAANGFAGSEMAPTSTRLAAATAAKTEAAAAMRKWSSLSTTGLAALNTKRKAAGLPIIAP